MRLTRLLPAALVFVSVSGPAAAQFAPGSGNRGAASEQGQARNQPGKFDYYALALSWSPTYCGGATRNQNDPQCSRSGGRPYAFVLHGLWPQHERGWPENCATGGGTYVPRPLIDRMLDIMPSPRLVIHEFRKHGTCSGLDAEAYFGLSRTFYEKVKHPPRFDRPSQYFTISPAEVVKGFVEVNPGLKPAHMAVVCGGPGNRLREVRICFTRDGAFRSCGDNESPRRLCSAASVTVPPVR